jgi:hypothetical protein
MRKQAESILSSKASQAKYDFDITDETAAKLSV